MCSDKEFSDWLDQKAKDIHDETWDAFKVGLKPSVHWYCAKDKEILIGEVIRKYQETHNARS